MKALSNLKSAINQSSLLGIVALIAIAPVTIPSIVIAAELQTAGQQALVFQIKNPQTSFQNQSSLTLEQATQKDPLVVDLQNYLEANNSPLKDYAAQLVSHDNWKTVVAISFVESNMCVHHYYYNCSGIGGQEYLRKYDDFGGWIEDMSKLLDKRYSGWTLAKMDGVYVQPYSYNWKIGSEKVLGQLTDLENNAIAKRVDLAQTAMLTQSPELALLTK